MALGFLLLLPLQGFATWRGLSQGLQQDSARRADAERRSGAMLQAIQVATSVDALVARYPGPVRPQAALDRLLTTADISLAPLEAAHLHWALEGWRRYGKGRHRAALNLGDCFSYGLANALQAPLLFKGEDCAATDLSSALAA